ncbi:MAG TPA: hypothetical protein VEA37_02305 [Flavobacterium sp.]|nr:hypothetical protein [Flavobacterium sp.]
MERKKIILLVILLVVLIIGGYFISKSNSSQEPLDTSSQGKLDINVVCESALSYMTFENSEAADQFLEECKDGKHPGVIEQYKAQMNLGDGSQI